ncbi:KTSC domain-containing protein [Herbaspirillum chlorophenolicum]|uniref:KTSC domain-containing protein n=1 Tax=Herbaspirillum chlorophenolicum TaxID=211589 RepID=A0ABW8F5H6_9BURK
MTTEAIQHPTIAMDAVESTQIAAIGHDTATNTLAIQFPGKGDKPGSVYHYANFTADDFKAFQEAESKGSHFGKHIKKNTEKYPYTRVS